MQIEFIFGDEFTQLSPAGAARILADLNYLHLAALAAASGRMGDLAVASIESGPERYGFAATTERPQSGEHVRLLSVDYGSPFKVLTGVFHFPELAGNIRQAWSAIEAIVMFRNRRERMDAETALIRQQELATKIDNFGKLRELLDSVPDEAERERLERALTSSIVALIDGRHPPLKLIEARSGEKGEEEA